MTPSKTAGSMTDQHVALVTGATGFLGRHVIKAFDHAGWKTVGTGFTRADPPTILKANLVDETAVGDLVDKTA